LIRTVFHEKYAVPAVLWLPILVMKMKGLHGSRPMSSNKKTKNEKI
jgi:hypothetical protein